MITILSMLEKGYESSFEHLTFRQLQGAYRQLIKEVISTPIER